MSMPSKSLNCFLAISFVTILHRVSSLNSLSAVCQLSFTNGNTVYNFSSASPVPNFPHGVLSEDGFFKVVVNETVLRFHVGTIRLRFICFSVGPHFDCGLSLHCGIGCTALVTENVGDNYHCHRVIMVSMSSNGSTHNCSLSVSVICDPNGIQGPHSLEKLGFCNYATVLHHPSGCATVISVDENGLGWFGTFMVIVLCLFGGYILVGMTYRHFFLGVHGLDMIPNLDFWAGLPHKKKKFKGPAEVHRSSYSQVNFGR